MTNKKIQAYKITVKGRVQGVGFRYWVSIQAKHLGIKGTIRNRADYSVEIIAEADKKDIDEFLSCLKDGHPIARVEELLVKEIQVRAYKNFSIVI